MAEKIKCDVCDDSGWFGISKINGELVCDTCETESEPIGSVYYNDDSGELDDSNNKKGSMDIITPYRNETPFELKWKKTDDWRGHYIVEKSDGWVNVHSDCILSGSVDSAELKEFDKKFGDFCEKKGIRIAKVFAITSNLFSSGYDLFVPEINVRDVEEFISGLKEKHRSVYQFNKSVWSGK